MVKLVTGNIFDNDVDIRVNTVNCVGVMGKGLALAFKERYPQMFAEYKVDCNCGLVRPGEMHIWKTDYVWIVNFPTKRHWRQPSCYDDIENGLRDLRMYLKGERPVTVAMPALGCGHGGLEWSAVKDMILLFLDDLYGVRILLYPPKSSQVIGKGEVR